MHGFFVVGSPDETVEDMRATFDFAARLRLDTFGFNRLCVYRGTPLWHEYLQRGLVNDADDWYKYFKCSEIDPTCLPGEVINAERTAGFRRLFLYKLPHYPMQTFRLLRRFLRYMPLRDVRLSDRQAVPGAEARSDDERNPVARGRARGGEGRCREAHAGR